MTPCYETPMSTILRQPMTLGEFLAWDERQELRHEFNGVRPTPMLGPMLGDTYAHDVAATNLKAALGTRLRGTPCRLHGPQLKISAGDRVRYADAFVSCQPYANTDTFARDPVVIFEVLEPDTAGMDRIEKMREYTALPSLRRYVLLEQDRVAATVRERGNAGWATTVLTDAAALLMPEIGIELPLAELYEGVDLTAGPVDDEA